MPGFIIGMQVYSIFQSKSTVLKEKLHDYICCKAFGKIQYLFMIKTLSKLGIKGNFFNLLNNIYRKPITNIIYTFFEI